MSTRGRGPRGATSVERFEAVAGRGARRPSATCQGAREVGPALAAVMIGIFVLITADRDQRQDRVVRVGRSRRRPRRDRRVPARLAACAGATAQRLTSSTTSTAHLRRLPDRLATAQPSGRVRRTCSRAFARGRSRRTRSARPRRRGRRRRAAPPRRAARARSRRAGRRPVRRAGTARTVAGATAETHVGAAGRGARLLERRLDAVGHEVERRAALHLDRLARVVREHEHRVVVRRLVTPPAVPAGPRRVPRSRGSGRTCCGP